MYLRILLIIILPHCLLMAQNNQISLALNDIPELLQVSSPYLKIINSEMKSIESQGDVAIQWNNPELIYNREQVSYDDLKESEQFLFLSKTFSFPWNYQREKSIWQENIAAAGLEREQRSRELLATARTEYVRASLLNARIANQTELKEILKKLRIAISAREEEGAISKMESGLLTMSIFGVESELIQAQTAFRQSLNSLKQLLGIPSSDEVMLTTIIGYTRISEASATGNDMIENHPGLRAHGARLAALEESVALEKQRIMPTFTLQGGYKRNNQNWEGYILGISLPVPILNWNRPQIEVQAVRQGIQSETYRLYRQMLQLEQKSLLKTINATMSLINEVEIERQKFTIVEDLLLAYQEGIISLTEFLNSILMYRESVRQYTNLLTDYYQAIFQVEALKGQRLIKF